MLYTREQFATKELMEHHENVAQGVTERQTSRYKNVKQAAAAPTTTSICVKPADTANMTGMIPRQDARRQRLRCRTTRCMIEVQNDAMHDRGWEERTHSR